MKRRADKAGIQAGEDIQARGNLAFESSTAAFRDVNNSLTDTVNQVGLTQAVGSSREAANQSFDTAEGSLARRQAGLGLQESDRQKAARGRQFSLGRAIATDEASTNTRRGFADRSIAGAEQSVSIGDSLSELEDAGYASLSNAAGAEQQKRDNVRAGKSAARAQTAATVAGIGLSVLALSDENVKHDKRPAKSLLDKLKSVRVDRWKYDGEDNDHIGPYAQEFNDTFEVGAENRTMINLVDAVGVAMGAIKELNQKVEAHG